MTLAVQNSRQTIFDRLRSIPIRSEDPPLVDQSRLVHYTDPVAKFIEILTHVGGKVHLIETPGQAGSILRELPDFNTARHVVSLVPEAIEGNFHSEQVDDPHSLATIDWAIVEGAFAVAENGAIWVRPGSLAERAMLFLTQHLAVIVSRSDMAMHMHEAYRRLSQSGQCGGGEPGFGVFISGPSKTADIEQSLVIGAHGCRTMHVFLTP